MTSTTRFRKKPVTVDAIRNEGEWAPVLAWLDAAGYMVPFLGRPAITRNADGSLSIETLEGTMRADVGDWVIRGIKGEFYPCKDDVFRRTYEPANAAAEGEPAPGGIETRLHAAEQVCVLVGWTAAHSESDLDKALHEAWREWQDIPGVSTAPEDHPELGDERIAELARRRDEMRAQALATLRGAEDGRS